MASSGPAPHPFFAKMNTEQVGKVIENMDKESIRDHEDRMSSKKWGVAVLVVILVSILLLSADCLWKDKLEYIAPIITALIAGVGGYGIGLSRNGRRDETIHTHQIAGRMGRSQPMRNWGSQPLANDSYKTTSERPCITHGSTDF